MMDFAYLAIGALAGLAFYAYAASLMKASDRINAERFERETRRKVDAGSYVGGGNRLGED